MDDDSLDGVRGSHEPPIAAVVAAIVAVILVVFIGGDIATRAFVEARIRSDVVEELPDGMAGDVNVSVGGPPMLVQLVFGEFAQVTVVSKGLIVHGVPVSSTVVATNVPFDSGKPIAHVASTVSLTEDAVNASGAIPGPQSVAFRDGTLVYSAASTSRTETVTPAVSADGLSFTMTPLATSAADASLASADGGAATQPTADPPLTVCAAGFIPVGLHIASITPTAGTLTITLEGDDVAFPRDTLNTVGTCP